METYRSLLSYFMKYLGDLQFTEICDLIEA